MGNYQTSFKENGKLSVSNSSHSRSTSSLNAPPGSPSNEPTGFMPLSTAEKLWLKSSWKHHQSHFAKHGGSLGMNIFLEILQNTSPAYWTSLKLQVSSPEELRSCIMVKAHAQKLEAYLGEIVAKLNTPEEESILELVRKVGHYHTNFRVHFDAPTWLVFKKSILSSLSTGENLHTQKAWSKLIAVIIGEMKRAFNSEICRKNSQRRRSSTASVRAFLIRMATRLSTTSEDTASSDSVTITIGDAARRSSAIEVR